MSETCEIPDECLQEFRKFKLSKSKTTNVISYKINVKELKVEVEDVQEGVDWDVLREDLPESVPRFLIMSYEWKMDLDRVRRAFSFFFSFFFFRPFVPPGFVSFGVSVLCSVSFGQVEHAVCFDQEPAEPRAGPQQGV